MKHNHGLAKDEAQEAELGNVMVHLAETLRRVSGYCYNHS